MVLRPIHHAAVVLHTSDELVRHYQRTTDLPPESVAAIIKGGIDTLYDMRNADANMHSAGAAAAIEAVLRYREVATHIPARLREDRADDEPWTDPVSGVTHPIDPRDVLDQEEYHQYQHERRRR